MGSIKTPFVMIYTKDSHIMKGVREHLIKSGIPLSDVTEISWKDAFHKFIGVVKEYAIPSMGWAGPYLFMKQKGSLVLVARGGKAICAEKIQKPQ